MCFEVIVSLDDLNYEYDWCGMIYRKMLGNIKVRLELLFKIWCGIWFCCMVVWVICLLMGWIYLERVLCLLNMWKWWIELFISLVFGIGREVGDVILWIYKLKKLFYMLKE